MDDHFWPAMYPGIIVGFLMGLAAGNALATVLGAAGGLAGVVVVYFVFLWLGVQENLLSLAGLVGGAVVGAYLLMAAGRRLSATLARPAK